MRNLFSSGIRVLMCLAVVALMTSGCHHRGWGPGGYSHGAPSSRVSYNTYNHYSPSRSGPAVKTPSRKPGHAGKPASYVRPGKVGKPVASHTKPGNIGKPAPSHSRPGAKPGNGPAYHAQPSRPAQHKPQGAVNRPQSNSRPPSAHVKSAPPQQSKPSGGVAGNRPHQNLTKRASDPSQRRV